MKGGEVILAGKLENRWGGMIIKKNNITKASGGVTLRRLQADHIKH